MLLLNEKSLLAANFASTDESRYTLKAIQVTPEATIATNGHILGWISNPKVDATNFPVTEGFTPNPDDNKPFLLDLDTLKKVEKAIPKKSPIPIIKHAAFSPNCETVSICVNDLETPQVFTAKQPTGQFPNWQAVMPDADKAKFTVSIDAEYLEMIAKTVKKLRRGEHGPMPVCIRFYGSDSSVRFDARSTETDQSLTAVVMPIRADAHTGYAVPKPAEECEHETRAEEQVCEAEAEEASQSENEE